MPANDGPREPRGGGARAEGRRPAKADPAASTKRPGKADHPERPEKSKQPGQPIKHRASGRDAAAPRQARAKGPRRAVAGIALLTAGSLAGGVYAAVTAEDERARRAGPERDGPRPGAPGGPGGPGGPVTNVATGGQVAPLRRVVPPDVLAVGAGPISQARIQRIAKLGRVRDVIAVAGGAVQLQGRSVNALAVDPSTFRSWTPPATARANDLWAALAADRFVVSSAAAEQLRLSKGFPYPVVGRTMPNLMMGGSGALGLPGIDMLLHRKTGSSIGLVPNIAVLVNAPGVAPATTAKAVGRILGPGANVVNLHEQRFQSPANGSYLDLYKNAAKSCPGLSWTVLAAIGQVESDHGRNAGRSSAGALGPMQFMPATWKSYGVDGDGDGKADIMNPYDAIPAAARYLCDHGAAGGGRRLYKAVWHYNHADWYVQKVLNLARAYQARFR
ncbi:lytic transglycosylase domain-containing protein [Actinomadura viridis]|uniref:lytic transglycosylase domain-containing protein n=1 Tax=Actinomadura viridis TaxID=58110 RepID=UPI0027DBEDEC|nr:lytic murein transglycosylase [Actinomadura viridis]